MELEQVLEIARTSIQRVTYSVLTTYGADGCINARVMQHFKLGDDWALWFGTSPRSRKAEDVRRNPQATVVLQDNGDTAYVTVSGKVTIHDDLALRKARWMEEWRSFFPDGPEGDDYVLLELIPQRMELLNFKAQIAPPPFGLNHVDLEMQDSGWVIV